MPTWAGAPTGNIAYTDKKTTVLQSQITLRFFGLSLPFLFQRCIILNNGELQVC